MAPDRRSAVYGGGLAFLFSSSVRCLFPFPRRAHGAGGRGLSGSREQVLTAAADGEKVIIWHVPAKAGASVCCSSRHGDFPGGRVSRFKGTSR